MGRAVTATVSDFAVSDFADLSCDSDDRDCESAWSTKLLARTEKFGATRRRGASRESFGRTFPPVVDLPQNLHCWMVTAECIMARTKTEGPSRSQLSITILCVWAAQLDMRPESGLLIGSFASLAKSRASRETARVGNASSFLAQDTWGISLPGPRALLRKDS